MVPVARTGVLHHIVDLKKRHQLRTAGRTRQQAGDAPEAETPITVAVYPVLVRSASVKFSAT